jgi:CBS domain-containing protein
MTARELLNDDVPPLKVTDTVDKALVWMDEFHVSHLPVIDGKQFVGMISDDDLLDLDDSDIAIGKTKIAMLKPVLHPHQHAYDVLKIMAELSLDVIAVTDDEGNYSGSITLPHLADQLAKLAAVREPGGIMILEVNNVDYSMSQIAQIVEGNDAKVLSAYVAATPDSNKVEVTIKVNREDLSRIIQTFNRYNYIVKATFHHGNFHDDMKQRYDEFMNFINL